jgi:hypothetical protein
MKSNLIATEGSQGMNSDKKDYPLQGDVEEVGLSLKTSSSLHKKILMLSASPGFDAVILE